MVEHTSQANHLSGSSLPLADVIRRTLADEILAGTIPAGSRLDETSLANRFDVSRTPVREALKQLIASGLVEHHHRRGVFVSELSRESLAEMFEYAAEMEALSIQISALNMTESEQQQLLALHLDSHQFVLEQNINAYDDANIKIHELLFKGCHNRFLEAAVLSARAKVAPYRRVQFNLFQRIKASYQEHSEIIKFVLRGQALEAAASMRGHIHNSYLASQKFVDDDSDRSMF